MDRIVSRTSLDAFAIAVTAGIASIFVYALLKGERETILIVLLGFSAVFLLTPYEYAIEGGVLKIIRPFRTLDFPLSSIRKVTLLSDVSRGPNLRLFGIGGLLGYYGFYWFPGVGVAFVLARNRRNPTLIEFRDHRPIVISPNDAGFLANLGPLSIQ